MSTINKLTQTAKYKVLKKQQKLPKMTMFALGTSAVGSATYYLGGAGLLYDVFTGKDKKPKVADNSYYDQKLFKQFVEKQDIAINNIKDEGIVAKSKFAKVGLGSARVAATVCGAAGIANGVAMGLPLLAIGEGTSIAAAPKIETPFGLGLFGIALGAMNLSRILEDDARFVIDKVKFSNYNTKQKLSYIGKNLKDTFKELIVSTRELTKQTGRLFDKKTKADAVQFMKEAFVKESPSSFILQESMNLKKGVKIGTKVLKNPILMHTATVILGVGSIGLMVFDVLKSKLGQKVSTRAYNVGNAADNVALAKWGSAEVRYSGGNALKATQGRFFQLAGATILASQPGIDRKSGRAINWIGVGSIMAGFTFLHINNLKKAAKELSKSPEVNQLMRQWKLNVRQMFGSDITNLAKGAKPLEKAKLSNLFNMFKEKPKTQFDMLSDIEMFEKKIIKIIKEKNVSREKAIEEIFEGNPKMLDFAKKMQKFYEHLAQNEAKYNSDTASIKDAIKNIFDEGQYKFSKDIEHIGEDGNMKDTLEVIQRQTKRMFGETPEVVK